MMSRVPSIWPFGIAGRAGGFHSLISYVFVLKRPSSCALSSVYQRLPFESRSLSCVTVPATGMSHSVTITRVPLPFTRGSVLNS